MAGEMIAADDTLSAQSIQLAIHPTEARPDGLLNLVRRQRESPGGLEGYEDLIAERHSPRLHGFLSPRKGRIVSDPSARRISTLRGAPGVGMWFPSGSTRPHRCRTTMGEGGRRHNVGPRGQPD